MPKSWWECIDEWQVRDVAVTDEAIIIDVIGRVRPQDAQITLNVIKPEEGDDA